MNHPAQEEWAAYLYDELAEPRRSDLQAHLGVCADCKKQVEAWRRTTTQLDTWVIAPKTSRRQSYFPTIRWAAAASLVLGLGFLAGRWASPPSVDAEQLRADLRKEFAGQLDRAMAASRTETQQTFQNLATAWAQARQEDQQTTLALLQRAERNHQLDFVGLRRDLETVALFGEQGIRNTRNQFARLTNPGPSSNPDVEIVPSPSNQERK